MNIKVQMSMVLNLDKCLACHTCSLPCKNAWASAPGAEYIWFNNVETRPGMGYPKFWDNQQIHKGGWEIHKGRLRLRSGGRAHTLAHLFANPHLPPLSDYYTPWAQREEHAKAPWWQPSKRLFSDGRPAAVTLLAEPDDLEADAASCMQQLFALHLPRLCEHCLNPACVAACPSGALSKRPDNGIVLVDETRCRGWRFCVSSCPYKKMFINWKQQRARKCVFCHSRLSAGEPPLCAEACSGRVRYLGILLYDADQVAAAAAIENDQKLYAAQRELFLDPHDPDVRREALRAGLTEDVLDAARRSPIFKLVAQWKLALPLHPEFRTLPMVWYIPPTSPLHDDAPSPAKLTCTDMADHMRLPVHFMARLFTAGDEEPVRAALARLVALRRFMGQQAVLHPRNSETDQGWRWEVAPPSRHVLRDLALADLDVETARAMYRLLSLASSAERFVIPRIAQQPSRTEGCHDEG